MYHSQTQAMIWQDVLNSGSSGSFSSGAQAAGTGSVVQLSVQTGVTIQLRSPFQYKQECTAVVRRVVAGEE